MKQHLLNLSMLCLMLLVSAFASAQDETALWDFQNVNPSSLSGLALQGTTGTVASTLDGVELTVDATNGKLKQRDSDAQFNAGTIIQVPVRSTRDIVTVTSYPNYHNYTIGGTAADADAVAHTANASEVAQGYVEIVGTGSSYLYSIKAEYISAVQEKKLYSTTFTEWGDYETKATTTETTVSWQTKYSHETLTFSIFDTQIGASNFNTGKFPNWEGGMLMAAKSSDPYILTSTLASITKVTFVHGATGSKRGWKLEAKGDGDSDWVTISEAVADPSSGATVNAEVNRTNCQLRFTNLNSSQNAYLFSLDIYGNVDLSKTPTLGKFKVNGTEYIAGDIFSEDNNGNMVATVEVSKLATMISESNPLTDISADNGEVTSTTYTANGTGCTVTMTVKAGDAEVKYVLSVIQKPDYTVTYYNTDGSALGTQTVEKDSEIGTLAKSEADVTVAEGKAFRGWFVEADGGRKVTASEVITGDLALYAVATDIETASTTASYTYKLNDKYFYDEDHEAINISGAEFHDGTHGWAFNADSKTELLVGGNAYIIFDLCQYSKGTLTLTDASGNVVSSRDAAVSKDGTTVAIKYEGAAGTLTLTGDGTYYIHKIVIANTQDSPIEKNESGIYVVKAGDAANFLNTLTIANANASSDSRTVIFLPNGTYDLGNDCLTPISGNNISIIGQSMEGTIIKNLPEAEGIGVTATLYITGSNTYLQDLTLQNAYPYYNGGQAGRAVCLQDKGSRTICKNVEMKSYQDTYYSNANKQFYFETSNIHGTVDFICGGGDVYFNECTLTVEPRNADGSGECTLTAPYTDASNTYGYVFNNCTINSLAAKFNYGRAWGGVARCAYLNTTLLQPDRLNSNRWTAAGMNVAADKFVEYNTLDEDGKVISPDSWVMTFTKDKTSNKIETILTDEQAAEYALDKVFTDWTPSTIAAQKSVEGLKLADNTLSWTATEGVTNYAVFKDDVLLGFTASTTYSVDTDDANYKVRAANEMGGLGEAAEAGNKTGISSIVIDEDAANTPYYNIMGVQVPASTKGLLIHNGKKVIVK